MRRIRVIPTLLIQNRKLVKTTGFKNPSYVGDPINALRIFNDKEVDEICVLDIQASRDKSMPDMEYLRDLASECFMPLAYGGGVTTPQQANELFKIGIEKIVFGTTAVTNPDLIRQVSAMAGAQSVVVALDYRKDWLGSYQVYYTSGTQRATMKPVEFARYAESLGAGELLIQNIDREGSCKGYDLTLLHNIAHAVSIPVIFSGGAASTDDFLPAIQAGASAVAAGAMFVYKGPNRAVLINYPDQHQLKTRLYDKL